MRRAASITTAVSAQIVPLQQQTTLQPSLALTYALDQNAFVHVFAGTYAPSGLGAANGQLVSIAENLALFNIIGTTYGGDGLTTFALPDLNGRVALGSGTGPGLSTTNLGDTRGSETVFLNSTQYPPGVGGLAQPFSNVQPSLTLNYIIADQGIFPSRPESGGNSAGGQTFLGQIALFAGAVPPRGWRFANGSLVPINTSTALFSLLGNTYGGNGTTTFALPDLRGRTPIDVGAGPGLTPRVLGGVVGTETTTLTDANIPAVLGGAGQPYNNMQPSLGINFMISKDGIYPARGSAPIDFVGGTDAFLGELFMFGGDFIPAGYWATDGALRPINQNTALFSLLENRFGGDGRVTFALPDLRGRAGLGGGGTGPGLSTYTSGDAVGVETVFLNAVAPPVEPPPITAVPEPATFLYVVVLGCALIAHRTGIGKKRRA